MNKGDIPTISCTKMPYGLPCRPSAHFQTSVVRFPAPKVAVVSRLPTARRRALAYLIGGIASLIGVGAVSYLAIYVLPENEWTVAIWIITLLSLMMLAGALTSIGVTALRSLARQKITYLDKRRGRVWQEGKWIEPPCPTAERRISDVAAVQVSNVTAGEVRTRLALNLVFSDPAGDRLTLTSHGNCRAILADAKALAEFLDVPLLDESDRIEIRIMPGKAE